MTDAQIVEILSKFVERPTQMSGWEPLLRGIREVVFQAEDHKRRNMDHINLSLKTLLERCKADRQALKEAAAHCRCHRDGE